MKKLVVANWKANITAIYNFQFTIFNDIEIAIAAAFPFINMLPEGVIRTGQDVSRFENGAYTGEVTAEMLKSLGVKYCLVGHSERRKYFGETTETVKEKAQRLLEKEIIPIVCAQDENEIPTEILKQVQDDKKEMIIMYEPETAISTPDDFHPEDPKKVAEVIENWREKYKTKILYGGSVNGENVKDYPGADGFVVGQASLEAASFLEIIKALED